MKSLRCWSWTKTSRRVAWATSCFRREEWTRLQRRSDRLVRLLIELSERARTDTGRPENHYLEARRALASLFVAMSSTVKPEPRAVPAQLVQTMGRFLEPYVSVGADALREARRTQSKQDHSKRSDVELPKSDGMTVSTRSHLVARRLLEERNLGNRFSPEDVVALAEQVEKRLGGLSKRAIRRGLKLVSSRSLQTSRSRKTPRRKGPRKSRT